jgi:hypothetical protein
MSQNKNATDIRNDYISVMGQELGTIFYELYQDVSLLHAKWNQYVQLYATSDSRLELLNHTAGSFFAIIQYVLWNDLLLHIGRLSDPKYSMGDPSKPNLSLHQLPDALEESLLKEEVKKTLNKLDRKASSARDWRNRKLAHNSLLLLTDLHVKPLPRVTYSNLKETLALIAKIMNLLEMHYRKAEVSYDMLISQDNADSLVYYLRVATYVEARNRQKMARGELVPEDEMPSDW